MASLCPFALLLLLVSSSVGVPVEGPGRINDLPVIEEYQPVKPPVVPIVLGERSTCQKYPFFSS